MPSFFYTYNNANLPLTVGIKGETTPLITYLYNDKKTVNTGYTYANGLTITYEYDTLRNVERVLKNGTPIYSCELDADMQLIREQDYSAGTETQYFYTAAGELYLTHETRGDNVILSYTLTDDANNKTDSIIEINGVKLTYSSVYDEENDISKYILPNLEEITSDTDDSGRTTAVHLKDADGNTLISCTYAYVDKTVDGQVKTSEYVSSITYSNGDRYEYTYDANGNITRYREGTVVMEYHYDELGQIIREDNGYAKRSWTYTYDNAGNILTKTEYPYSTGMLGGSLSRIDYGYSSGNWGDQLTSYRGQTFTYDALGNPVVWRDIEATWEGRNLVSYMGYNFTYDANGLRTAKDDLNYIYDENNNLVEQIWDYGDEYTEYVYFYYDESGSPVSFDYMGEIYYYVKNQQGDILKIVDADGNVIAGYRYDAWGKVLSTYGDDNIAIYVNPLLYRGYYYDWETELYYLQSRYYDPAVGRFLNADDIDYLGASGTVLGYNLFVYCGNGPVVKADPEGTDAVILQYRSRAKGLGHMGAIVQDKNGQWYYFYWGSSIGTVKSIFMQGKAFCLLDPLYAWGNFYLAFSTVRSFLSNRDKFLNKYHDIKYSDGLSDTIYLSGDYSKTFDYYLKLRSDANNKRNVRVGIYNLYTFNCKHATLQGLLKSPCVYNNKRLKSIITSANMKIIPNEAFDYIQKQIHFYIFKRW